MGKYEYRLVATYLRLCERHAGTLLVAALLSATVGIFLARDVQLDPRLEALLPPDTPAQRAAREAQERFAGGTPYYLTIQSSDPVLNRRISDEALARVREWDETLWAINRRDGTYFYERRLLYLDADTLEEFAEEVELYGDWHRCRNMPGCVNLEDEPPEPDFDRLEERYRELPELRALTSLFGSSVLDSKKEEGEADGEGDRNREGEVARSTAGPSEDSELMGELCSQEGNVCVVQVALRGNPGDLEYASAMLRRGEALLESLRPPNAPSDMILAVTGMYRNLPLSRDAVLKDLGKAFLLGLSLVAAVLMLQFRGVRAIVLLVLPLVVGLAWTAGFIALTVPTLDLISSTLAVLLAGLGIDFGVHLLTHYGSHRRAGRRVTPALEDTLQTLLTPLLLGAGTTACAFAALTSAQFRGFAQLGVLAAAGISLTLLATLLTFPPVVYVLERNRSTAKSFSRDLPLPRLLTQPLRRRPAMVILALGALSFGAALWATSKLEMEYRFDKLEPKVTRHGTRFGSALHGTSRSPVLLLADTREQLEEVARELRELYPNGLRGDEGPSIITPGTFVPPEQERRLAALHRLREQASDLQRHASKRLARALELWHPLLDLDGPIRDSDLPRWAVESFSERDGSFGTVGLLYTTYSGSDARQMMKLSEQLDQLRQRFPQVRFASAPAVLGEVVPLLRRDGPRLMLLVLLGLLAGTALLSRSLLRALLVAVPVVMALTGTAACMTLLDWKVNLYNMVVFPVSIGIGIDGAVYVVWSVLRQRRKRAADWSQFAITSRAVLGSTLTTMAGFGCLVTSTNGGLTSLGLLAILGFTITLVTNLVFLPALLVISRPPPETNPQTAGAPT